MSARSSCVKASLIFCLIFLSKTVENLMLHLNNLRNNEFDKNNLIFNCVRDIVRVEQMRTIFIVGRPEHFLKLDLARLGNMTGMKIYKRIMGWRRHDSMLEFKGISYILTLNRYQEFEEYIDMAERYYLFNSRLRFVIIPLYNLSQAERERYGKDIINHKIINYLLIIPNLNKTSIDLVSNFPYRLKACGNYLESNDRIIATYDNEQGFKYLRRHNRTAFYTPDVYSPLYPSKVPRNLHKCVIRIVTGLWPPNVIDVNRSRHAGIEIDFIRTISKYMNFVPNYLYTNADVGRKLSNNSWTGFMGYLQRDEADMAIGAVHVDSKRLYAFDVSDWYLYNLMLWIVPLIRPPEKSAMIEHFIVDSSTLTKVLAISVLLSACFAMLIAARIVRTKDSRHYGKVGYVLVVLLRMFLAQSCHSTPKTVQVRRIYGICLGFSTFIIFFFQTSITSYFLLPSQPVQLDNIQQAFNLKLRISYDRYYDDFVINATHNVEITKLNENFPVIPSLNLVSKGEAVTFIDRLRAIYISKQWLREDGSIPIRLLYNNPVHRYWVQVVMTKGHFLSAWINKLVDRSWYNGFWDFKENLYIDRRTIQCSVRRQIILSNDIQGIDNTKAIERYNDAIYEAFPKGAANEEVNKIFQPTAATEDELLEMFRVSTDSSINFGHLETAFELYLSGVLLSFLVFLLEILIGKTRRFCKQKKRK